MMGQDGMGGPPPDMTGGMLTNPDIVREQAGMAKPVPRRKPNVTKEQQQQYDTVVLAAKELLYSKGMGKNVVKMATRNPEGIAEGIGDATAKIMAELYRAGESKGEKMPGRVVVPASMEVMADIIDMVNTASGTKMSDADMASATQATVGNVLKEFGATEQHIQQFMSKNKGKPGMKQALESQFALHTNDGTPVPSAEQPDQGMPMPEEGMPPEMMEQQ